MTKVRELQQAIDVVREKIREVRGSEKYVVGDLPALHFLQSTADEMFAVARDIREVE